MPTTGLILLAAGGSTRMGRPKQLLRIGSETLLRRAAKAALASVCTPVVIVLGEKDDLIDAQIAGLTLRIIRNEQWQAGMGGSIRRGITAIASECAAVIVMLCDQPAVTTEVIDRLAEAHVRSGKLICASAYADTVGPPCLFSSAMFPKLLAIPDNAGAKRMLTGSPEDLETIPFPDGALDIDTPADYAAIIAKAAKHSMEAQRLSPTLSNRNRRITEN